VPPGFGFSSPVYAPEEGFAAIRNPFLSSSRRHHFLRKLFDSIPQFQICHVFLLSFALENKKATGEEPQWPFPLAPLPLIGGEDPVTLPEGQEPLGENSVVPWVGTLIWLNRHDRPDPGCNQGPAVPLLTASGVPFRLNKLHHFGIAGLGNDEPVDPEANQVGFGVTGWVQPNQAVPTPVLALFSPVCTGLKINVPALNSDRAFWRGQKGT